jgi:hypothetical protein
VSYPESWQILDEAEEIVSAAGSRREEGYRQAL